MRSRPNNDFSYVPEIRTGRISSFFRFLKNGSITFKEECLGSCDCVRYFRTDPQLAVHVNLMILLAVCSSIRAAAPGTPKERKTGKACDAVIECDLPAESGERSLGMQGILFVKRTGAESVGAFPG